MIECVCSLFIYPVLFVIALIIFTLIAIKYKIHQKKVESKQKFSEFITIGFFHPFCNSGGGGERVLWSAIKVIQDTYKNVTCIVYTGDLDCTVKEIVDKVNKRFKIDLDESRLHFVYLKSRFLVLDKCYPVLTLLGQSIGSMIVGLEAAFKFVPNVYFETTGYAFTYPIFYYLANVPVCCYTHYPTISTDMLDNVSQRNSTFNNRRFISNSKILTNGKLFYYKIFAKLYSLCGRCACCIMVNSSWTLGHINTLWSMAYRTNVVYPPCDVEQFFSIENEYRDENFFISSVAQFRPEKNHQLQVKSFAQFLNKLDDEKLNSDVVKLILIGSCRNVEDENRVNDLRQLAKDLKIENKVEFKLNLDFNTLLNELANSAVGLHSMKDEHFGIGVVECMAAGTITLANNSGGPKADIIVPYKGEKTGFLAETVDEYSDCLINIYKMSVKQRNNIRKAAREHVKKFSQNEFNISFMESLNNHCLNKFNLMSSNN